MPAAKVVQPAALLQAFSGELADGLQHREALAGATDEADLDERGECVQVGRAHRLRGVDRPPAREDTELREQPALASGEQVVAPLDRRPEGPLPLGDVSWTAAEGQPRAE